MFSITVFRVLVQCIWKHWWTFRLSENFHENLTVRLLHNERESCGVNSLGSGARWPWAWILGLPLTGWVTLYKLHCAIKLCHGSALFQSLQQFPKSLIPSLRLCPGSTMDLFVGHSFSCSWCFSLGGILAGPILGLLYVLVLHLALRCIFLWLALSFP